MPPTPALKAAEASVAQLRLDITKTQTARQTTRAANRVSSRHSCPKQPTLGRLNRCTSQNPPMEAAGYASSNRLRCRQLFTGLAVDIAGRQSLRRPPGVCAPANRMANSPSQNGANIQRLSFIPHRAGSKAKTERDASRHQRRERNVDRHVSDQHDEQRRSDARVAE